MATMERTTDTHDEPLVDQTRGDDGGEPRTDGLAGVWVADTRLSEVDGAAGRLVVAGEDIESLAPTATFEDMVVRLFVAAGALSADAGADEGRLLAARHVKTKLAAARVVAFERLGSPALREALAQPDGMAALRSAVALVRLGEPCENDAVAESLTLIAHVGVFVAAHARLQRGLAPIAPDPPGDHGADVFRMMTGASDPARERALTTYLVTVAEHGMNASTFTARVVASTGSDLVSAIVAGIGALKGPLHGGAPGPVLAMLDAIGDPADAEAFLLGEVQAKRRIMGMGHRIYRVRDPRAAVLERATQLLEAAGVGGHRLALARAVERTATDVLAIRYPDRSLAANVEFYTAVLLDAVGLPSAVFSPLFAAARVAGFCAHVMEQRACAKLMRPESRYVGPRPTSRQAAPSIS